MQVDATAAGLLALGVRPGDRVGVWGPNVPEWLLLQFATARVGAIQVNVNPSYRAHELEFALNKVCVCPDQAARQSSFSYRIFSLLVIRYSYENVYEYEFMRCRSIGRYDHTSMNFDSYTVLK